MYVKNNSVDEFELNGQRLDDQRLSMNDLGNFTSNQEKKKKLK